MAKVSKREWKGRGTGTSDSHKRAQEKWFRRRKRMTADEAHELLAEIQDEEWLNEYEQAMEPRVEDWKESG